MSLRKEIIQTLLLVWPLLAGMFLIMIGNGLQGTLLSLRAEFEGFPVSVIGIIMSMYYCGYLGGWYIVPRMIDSVGHIRVFAGFASLASTTILIQGLFIDPFTWSAVRLISGISFVGLFIVSESWLNDISTNKLRARIFSAYIFVVHGGLFLGQFLINLAPVETISLFILISVLVSLSLIPVTLASKATPSYEEPENLPFKKLMGISPFSVACVLTSGFCGAALLAMGPVYASMLGFDVSKIALFIAAYILGCAILPLFIGWISDYVERRKVLIAIAVGGLLTALFSAFNIDFFYITNFIFGGFVSSIYIIAVAMMNDWLEPRQRTSATASLILLNGISSCISPILIGTLLQYFGASAFFHVFTFIFAGLTILGIYRAWTGPQINVEAQHHFQNLPTRSSPGAAILRYAKARKEAKQEKKAVLKERS